MIEFIDLFSGIGGFRLGLESEYLNVYMWARNERKKGKDAGILGSRSGEYIIWHEDYTEAKQ